MDNKGTDGKDRVLMSNPGGSGRNNGMLRIGEVTETKDSFSVKWVNEKMFCPGNYAYSCLTRMADGNFGLLYEHNNTIKFTAFNEAYVKEETNLLSPTISSVEYSVEKTDDHKYAVAGDTYVFTVNVSQKIVDVKGNPQLRFVLNGETKYADFASLSAGGKALTFEYVIQKGDEGLISYRGPKVVCDDENYAKNEYGYNVSAGDLEVSLGYIGADPSDNSRDIPVSVLKAAAGDAQSGEGADKAVDNNAATMWHTNWNIGPDHSSHWIQLELTEEYMVDGFRYQPRQSGGSNGIITGYEIQVSNDGKTFTTVAKGEWKADNAWKAVSFAPQNVKYVRLQTTDAVSDQAIKFASAAEIRLTGVEAEACVEHITELRGKVEATCTEDGYTGDAVCTNCGTVVTKGEAVEAFGHSFGEWVVVKEATETEKGSKERVCGNCEKKETEEIPKLETPEPVNPFKDVVEGQYYYDSVLWAVENKVTSGLSADTFGVGNACTREQIVTFLWNYAGQPEATQTECAFKDVNSSHYYYKAMLWAVEKKITSGLSSDIFGVGRPCTREQIVTFLWNYAGQPAAAKKDCAFTDVNEGHYYYKAMLWAVESGIVAGYNNHIFGTGDACTREQIVTFLYRYDAI